MLDYHASEPPGQVDMVREEVRTHELVCQGNGGHCLRTPNCVMRPHQTVFGTHNCHMLSHTGLPESTHFTSVRCSPCLLSGDSIPSRPSRPSLLKDVSAMPATCPEQKHKGCGMRRGLLAAICKATRSTAGTQRWWLKMVPSMLFLSLQQLR